MIRFFVLSVLGGKVAGIILSMMSDWFQLIALTLYGGADEMRYASNIIDRTTTMVVDMVSIGTVMEAITGVGVALMFVYLFSDMLDRIGKGEFKEGMYFKLFFGLAVCSIFIGRTRDIATWIVHVVTSMLYTVPKPTNEIYEYFSDPVNVSKFQSSLQYCDKIQYFGYILRGLPAFLLCAARQVMVYYVYYERMFALVVMTVFSPIAAADFVKQGGSSGSSKYFKRMFATALRPVIVYAIIVTTQALMEGLDFGGMTAAEVIAPLLDESTGGLDPAAPISDENCIQFLENLFGTSANILTGGATAAASNMVNYFARLAIIILQLKGITKSKDWSNEIAGLN